MMENTKSLDHTRPVSWEAARLHLRDLLEDYLHVEKSTKKSDSDRLATSNQKQDSGSKRESIFARTVDRDLDLYAGAMTFAIVLLVLSCACLVERIRGIGSEPLRPGAGLPIYRAQVSAACLLVAGSMASLWMVHRRRFLALTGTENGKRREILSFLKHLDRYDNPNGSNEWSRNHQLPGRPDALNDSNGCVLTGLYPVYRRVNKHKYSAASWKRVPSLLLVEGDYVALQVGDISPAPCQSLDTKLLLATGDRLSLDSLKTSAAAIAAKLPRGRSTFSPHSKGLLTLCNEITIFRVSESPLHQFLHAPCALARSSQVSRQVRAVRIALWAAMPVFLILTAVIVFSRPGAASGDLSLLLPLPLLASLGVLPVVGPAFAFFLEIVGTARILSTVHPYAIAYRDRQEVRSRMALLLKYIVATSLSRLSLWDATRRLRRLFRKSAGQLNKRRAKVVRVPPASVNLLEQLGVCTAFTLIDDELACEPHAIPQQLLIPSGKGLRLLDLCPAYDDEDSQDAESSVEDGGRKRGKSFESDSSSEDDALENFNSSLRRKVLRRPRLRRPKSAQADVGSEEGDTTTTEDSSFEVQFEDPLWWQHLPSLKCIGLSSLVIDRTRDLSEIKAERTAVSENDASIELSATDELDGARGSLVKLVSAERESNQLQLLADCIGFTSEENSFGERGDLSPFTERLRLHILSSGLFKERLELDAHERSSEQARWWGLIRPDSTSAIVHDSRSDSYQLLTVGDPQVVSELCNEAWQGEISTILPLSAVDRRTILETSRDWKLADLDVAAFSFSPVPHMLESRLSGEEHPDPIYLLDNGENSLNKSKSVPEEWSLVRNQIFLGVLGSLVVPRREIQGLLSSLSNAGVRFVYFSPRNMRRQKELAAQMGIDVAWNCAISLRPLKCGEDDPHRMVSNYADWDVNAKLPHGVADVRLHLDEVDNVPLLVSLFTDVTKDTTKEMVEIFQEYNDTVISVGLSHLPRNTGIFSSADIAVSIDVLSELGDHFFNMDQDQAEEFLGSNHVLSAELEFVSAMSSHSCAFRFRGASALNNLPAIIREGRGALDAAYAGAIFLVTGCLSFSLFTLFSACAVSTTIPFVPTLGAVLYLQIVLPLAGLSIAFSAIQEDAMKQVPTKNDQSEAFYRNQGQQLYQMMLLKALPPALLSQIFHLIVFGELILAMETDLAASACPGALSWVDMVRCDGLKSYSGPARTISGSIVLAVFICTMLITSVSFVRRHVLFVNELPWECNAVWVCALLLLLALVVVYVVVAADGVSSSSLPWYFYVLVLVQVIVCVVWNELCKRIEIRRERRAEKLRRLQFETRLGAWSPK